MNPALVFLLVRSLRGRLVRWLRLMRQPKYLIGFLFGAVWFVLWFGSAFLTDSVRFDGGRSFHLPTGDGDQHLVMLYGGSVALAAALTLWWAVPFGRSVLELKESELHLLLPAPLPRRDVMQYSLIKHQPGILFGAVIMATFLTRGSVGHRVGALVTFWGLLTLWNLHSRGRGLWLARLRELPVTGALRRRATLYGLLAAYWAGLIPGLAVVTNRLARTPSDQWDHTLAASGVWEQGIAAALAGWLLQPLLWLLQPLFIAADSGLLTRLGALLPLLVLLALHNRWVVRSQVRFEESALARARELASRASSGHSYRGASEKTRRRHPFALGPRGLPEVAILWKNLIQVHRIPLTWVLPAGLAALSLPLIVASLVSLPVWLPGGFLFVGWLLLIASPFLSIGHWRNDLRSDLLQLDLVKTWPLAPWRLVLAEISGPTTLGLCYAFLGATVMIGVTAAVEWVDAGGGQIRLLSDRMVASLGAGPVGGVALATAGAVPVLTAMAALSTAIQNVLALTFPGWVHLGPRQRQTAARMGQNLLLTMALMLGLAVGLIPGVLLTGSLLALQLWVLGWEIHAVQLPLLGLLLALPVFAECGLLVGIASDAWKRLDPSRELLSGQI